MHVSGEYLDCYPAARFGIAPLSRCARGSARRNNTLVALPPSLVLPITVKLSKIKNLLPEQHLLSIDLH